MGASWQSKSAESEEMYLKAIYTVLLSKPEVYAVDICDELNYVKSSVSVGLKLLREKNLITVDEQNKIYFTKAGHERAKSLYDRYTAFTDILTSYDVPEVLAQETACKIEHDISDEVFGYIKRGRENQSKNVMKYNMTESEDMYLKAIYLLSKRQESIRAVDISNELCVTQSAVLKAERKLADDGYITLGAHKRICLTRKGSIRAEKIYERYTVFTDILKSCGVPENLAEETACKGNADLFLCSILLSILARANKAQTIRF